MTFDPTQVIIEKEPRYLSHQHQAFVDKPSVEKAFGGADQIKGLRTVSSLYDVSYAVKIEIVQRPGWSERSNKTLPIKVYENQFLESARRGNVFRSFHLGVAGTEADCGYHLIEEGKGLPPKPFEDLTADYGLVPFDRIFTRERIGNQPVQVESLQYFHARVDKGVMRVPRSGDPSIVTQKIDQTQQADDELDDEEPCEESDDE